MPRLSQVHPDPDPDPAPAPAPAQGQGNAGPNAPPGVLMRGPNAWIGLRVAQALLAAAALAAMSSAHGFVSVTAFGFRYLVSAAALQCLWSLALAILNFYAFLVGRSLRNPRVVAIRCVGDEITGTLTFSASAAWASAAITVFINNDMEACYENHCPSFTSATVMGFLSWFFLVNLNAVVKKLQRP